MKLPFKNWLRPFIRSGTVEFTGYTLIVFALFLAISLISYSPTDPSANRATSEPVANWGGTPGAYLADLVLQFIGLSGIFLVFVLAVWGGKLVVQKALTYAPLRVATLFMALPGVAALLAWISAPLAWPIITGLGGVVGVFVKTKLAALLSTFGALIFLILWTIPALYVAFGVRWREWRSVGRMATSAARYVSQGFTFIRSIWHGKSERIAAPKASPRAKTAAPAKAEPAFETAPEMSKTRVETNPKAKAAKPQPIQSSFELPETQGKFTLPPLNILSPSDSKIKRPSESALEQNARLLESVLSDFGVNGEITKVRPGPVVTLYELEPAAGTKSARVIGLADDIARSMSSVSARIAVIPGRNAIGIELPNANREIVTLREMCEDDEFAKSKAALAIALGKDIGGDSVVVDLAKMPHLLVAGTTGSGKSVAVNTMILSLIYRLTPEQCRFIMIDPKMLELSMYDGIPHLLSPVVTEPGKAVVALKWTVKEMENRYRLMSNLGVRNIDGYNKRIIEAKAKGSQLTRTVQTGFDPDTGKPVMEEVPLDMTPLPYIVVIVDEMADLMLVAGKDIEASIQRLAQMARAAGIHLIMATQRPSVDVITGVIKANFPTRISFQVTSRIDSRTILGEQGAETLLGMGDMLYMAGGGRITRVHGPFVSDQEVETIVAFLKAQGEPQYGEDITAEEALDDGSGMAGISDMGGGSEEDQLFQQAEAWPSGTRLS
ncbi:MAG: DNA translocase FtsK, partial [Rickettsiales bacterium]